MPDNCWAPVCSAFNQPIGDWDVSRVENFYNMFLRNKWFNQHLDRWDTRSAVSMRAMFQMSRKFNGRTPFTITEANNVDLRVMFKNTNNWDQVPLMTFPSTADIGHMFGAASGLTDCTEKLIYEHVRNGAGQNWECMLKNGTIV